MVIGIISVVYIDISIESAKHTSVVIVNIHATNTSKSTIVIPNIDSTYLRNTTIIVIVYRYILYLDYGSIVIVLNKRTIVKSGIEGYIGSAYIKVGTNIYLVVHVKIELTIAIYGKGNSIFHKNHGVISAKCIADSNVFFQGCGPY
jgi:hypothetical protein